MRNSKQEAALSHYIDAQKGKGIPDQAPILPYRRTFSIVVEVLEMRDESTANHSKRVAAMARNFCRALMLPHFMTDLVELVAELHDIGKVGVSDEILKGGKKLTQKQFLKMQRHTVIGSDMLEKVGHMELIAQGVRHHHERWDGTGYPDGLRGDDIPFSSLIVALCDSVDAMLVKRAYVSRALTHEECRQELQNGSCTLYSPVLTDFLLENWDETVKDVYRLK